MAKSRGGTRNPRPANSRPRSQRPTFGIGAGVSGGSGMNSPRQLPRQPRPMNTTPIYERGNVVRGIKPPPNGNLEGYRGVEPLKNIKDPKVYREIKRSISRFASMLGIPERNIMLADLKATTVGVQVSNGLTRKSKYILLNKSIFNLPYKQVRERQANAETTGWHTKTNKPFGHAVVHELAHALWEYNRTGSPEAMAAQSDIVKLRNKLKKDPDRTALGYGRYGLTNTNEFWSELIVKVVHGKEDYYTREAKRIIKQYNL